MVQNHIPILIIIEQNIIKDIKVNHKEQLGETQIIVMIMVMIIEGIMKGEAKGKGIKKILNSKFDLNKKREPIWFSFLFGKEN